jgi:hypothetical protein
MIVLSEITTGNDSDRRPGPTLGDTDNLAVYDYMRHLFAFCMNYIVQDK